MKYGRCVVLIVFIAHSNLLSGQQFKDWEDLLSKENVENWRIKIRGFELDQNSKNTFQLSENLLQVNYSEYTDFSDDFGHIFYNKEYSFYRLKFQYRFYGDQVAGGPGWAFRNNGIMLHSQSAESMLKDQDFPISVEVQLLGGNGNDPRPTLNVCTPGTHITINGQLEKVHCISSISPTFHGDEWVTAEVVVLGDSIIKHFVEDRLVLEYTNPVIGGVEVSEYDDKVKIDGKPLKSGQIALQAESHPTEFRNIRLLNLEGCMDKKAINYRDYFIKKNNSLCVYSD